MFPSDMNNHYALHNARQSELEAIAENERRIAAVLKSENIIFLLRKRIGASLIVLGEKMVGQRPAQNIHLTFFAR